MPNLIKNFFCAPNIVQDLKLGFQYAIHFFEFVSCVFGLKQCIIYSNENETVYNWIIIDIQKSFGITFQI